MHRLAATPGGWTPDTEGVIFVEQTPAPLVILTAADTDIQAIAQALPHLPSDFPALRVANLLQLQQALTIDTYAEDVLEQAQGIVLRLLGGRAYWSYGLEVVQELAEHRGIALIVLPGDDRPDPDLMSLSTVPLRAVHELWQYFTEGGVENLAQGLQHLAQVVLGLSYRPLAPQPVPRVGRYPFQTPQARDSSTRFRVGVLFYRAHYLAGNTAPIDALCEAIAAQNLEPVPVFVASMQDPDLPEELEAHFRPSDAPRIDLLLNCTSFSLAKLSTEQPKLDLWRALDVPILQVILSGGTAEQWRSQVRGLSPRDTAMNVALPEVDGRIISRAVSFKAVQAHHPRLETDVVIYEPARDRVEFVAALAAAWVHLRHTPPPDRRVALVLANYPTRNGRLANGVGLDTPASCVAVLAAMQAAGYRVDSPSQSSEELIAQLTAGRTNDPENQAMWDARRQFSLPEGCRPSVIDTLPLAEYRRFFAGLPEAVQQAICDRWGAPDRYAPQGEFAIAGIRLGNVFVGIQPARGYDLDPALNYHAPDLEPPHTYLAFYYWLRSRFGAQAIAHLGKHGNLEWLPGKSVALAESCFPEAVFGPMPHLYPFIVNDPGEGSQAKRRAQAVILDHLTPPLTRAELYGPLQQVEHLVDEYYEAQTLDPTRLPLIRDRLLQVIDEAQLHRDLGLEEFAEALTEGDRPISQPSTVDAAAFETAILNSLDGYLCELKEAQIRDGLHIFGQCPQGRQLRDLAVAIARSPARQRQGLTRAIAQDLGLEADPLGPDLGERLAEGDRQILASGSRSPEALRTVGDAVEILEAIAARLLEALVDSPIDDSSNLPTLAEAWRAIAPDAPGAPSSTATATELAWISRHLLPNLRQTSQEITQFLRALDGRYVPSGPSGAPTRGRPEVLPTGRNFYSVDIRALPTETAWDVGRKAAEALVERYVQDNGEYPRSIGLSVWGTSTMRTGGDDIAEALALLGVQPVWDGPSRRVVDFEVLPVSLLGRPRVDVTLRISGFFRDAFPNLIDLFDQAVEAIAALPEPPDQNPLAAQVHQETQRWQAAGLPADQAQTRAQYRVFGSKPGAYGAGLQGLIEAQNWQDDADLARAYINWSSYAYTRQGEGRAAPEAFGDRLRQMQVVLHNQDNREHDLLDSDDYYQFQGGLTAAVRAIQGRNPQTYFGDHSRPESPRVRSLRQEIARVYRSRVVNPKWIAGVMRHGYKGAFEMAATVDYLFAYDATARCVEDHMYTGVAEAYLLDPEVQAFIQAKNPWALRDMAERLLEAQQRGLWASASPDLLDDLRSLVHEAEGAIEAGT